jgi:ATP-dependent Zn protease
MGTGFTSLRVADSGVSEATRRVRDQEVRELADEAMRAAMTIIDSHRPQLDELAATLLAKEVVERADIVRIMAGVKNARPARGSSARVELAAATAVDPAAPHPTGR